MRFSHIRLAGFKSFADAAVIPVSGRMTGVVGPNGCGKSNVVDAIRWVMGERSASALRGEDMHDVIFNGASSRPLSDRASVELHFHSVKLPPDSPWSAFHELNIKRLIYRNQTSDYFINNQKVRRKDVADLFLGTGLGPRSYAIIEQGMVSRIIESNPKDLKIFLEEAAGVSKYKERRAETEGRMEDARANLVRIEDIRAEVSAQVERLAQQAQVAQQYQSLQNTYLSNQRLIAVVQWSQTLAEQRSASAQLRGEEETLEKTKSAIAEMDRLQAEKTAQWEKAQASLEDAQAELSSLHSQIAELEQDLRLGAQKREYLAQNRQKLAARREQLEDIARRAEEELMGLEEQRENQQNHRAQEESRHRTLMETFYANERQLIQMRKNVEQARSETHALEQQQSATEQHRLAVEARLREIAEKRAQLESSLQKTPPTLMAPEANAPSAPSPYASSLQQVIAQMEELAWQLENERQAWQTCEQENERLHQALSVHRQEESALSAKIQTLERQLAVSAKEDLALPRFLAQQSLLPSRALEEAISASPMWKHALAMVLADWLGACWVDSLSADQLAGSPAGRLILNQATASIAPQAGTLAEVVTLADPGFSLWLVSLLNRYRLCPSWQSALDRRNELAEGEWWVSPDGVSVGKYALHFPGNGGVRAMHLENRYALDEALAKLQEVTQTIHQLLIEEDQNQKNRQRLTAHLQTLQAKHSAHQQSRQNLEHQEREWQYAQKTASEKQTWQIREWQQQLAKLMDEEQKWLAEIEQSLEQGDNHSARLTAQKAAWEQAQEALHDQELIVRNFREQLQQLALSVQKLQHQVDQTNRDLSRVVAQKKQNQQTLDDLLEQWQQNTQEWEALAEDSKLDASLQSLLTVRQTQEEKVAQLRQQMEGEYAEQKQSGIERLKYERQLEHIRTRIEKMRLKLQECDLRSEQFREHYVRYGGELSSLMAMEIAETQADAHTIAELQKAIADSETQMKALEPVNLASITEYDSESARLAELQKQQADLTLALQTLESAISKIDQETRSRMLEVFARVNVKFAELFRLIFGGGHAEIILTGEEILDAGVILKAQPLGKNNASIHLLSGGEKALTAIALVFAFFSLNPAPFCVLDEVDAPLDDANTRRFTELIRDMSQETQFLVISHNRITMEAMETLVGVTMRTAGISKVVSVDLLNAMMPANSSNLPPTTINA